MKHAAAPSLSEFYSANGYSRDDHTPKVREKSFSKVFPHDAHAKLLKRGQPIDPLRYKTMFPERWMAFLRAHHNSVEEVAFFYNVTARTAMNWWEGSHRPSGDKVAMAAVYNPDGFQEYLGVKNK